MIPYLPLIDAESSVQQAVSTMVCMHMRPPERLAVVSEIVGRICYGQMIFIFYRSEPEGQLRGIGICGLSVALI